MGSRLARLLLHVGPPKTGTTTIQHVLHACRSELLRHGIFYPSSEPVIDEGQPMLAWEIVRTIGEPVAYLSQASLSWEKAIADARDAGAHTLLVSSEDFCLGEFGAKAFAQLGEVTAGIPVNILFAVRDPARVVPSVWQQSVKWGIGSGEQLLDFDDAVPLVLRRDAVRVVPYLEQMRAGLKAAELSLFTVPETSSASELLSRMCIAAGFTDELRSLLCAAALRNTNQSMSYDQLLILLQINRLEFECDPAAFSVPQFPDPLRSVVRSAVIAALHRANLTITQRSVPLTRNARELIDPVRADIVEWLHGHDVVGGLQDLGQVPAMWQPDEPSTESLQDIRAVAMALHTMSQSLLRAHRDNERARSYLTEVERARDWWHDQSDRWQEIAAQVPYGESGQSLETGV